MARTLLSTRVEEIGPNIWAVHILQDTMDLQDHNPLSLVVAERDGEWESNWGGWVERFSTGTPDVVVVLQHPGESDEELAQRVRAKVDELDAAGRQIARAVIVGAGRPASETLSARSSAIKAIVAPMVEQGHGTLLLDGEGSDRFQMMALAETVAQMVRNTGVTVRSTDEAAARVA